MAERLKLKNAFTERPRSSWKTIATELLGCQIRFVKGKRWTHRIIEKGDGPPLFMYHGIGGHAEPHARVLPALARDFRVIAVDALYHGYSSKEPWDAARWTELQAEAYVDVLNALGYEKAIYSGESMGAGIGVEIALRFPQTVTKMVLNGFAFLAAKRSDWRKQPDKGDLIELSQQSVIDPNYDNIARRLRWLVHDDNSIDDEMIAIRQKLYREPEVNHSLRRIFGLEGIDPRTAMKLKTEDELKERWKTQALVMWGEFNPLRGADYGEYCADLIGAKFYEFKGVGHWPMWEAPIEYVEVLRSYLLT